jgi:hypothetical protein
MITRIKLGRHCALVANWVQLPVIDSTSGLSALPTWNIDDEDDDVSQNNQHPQQPGKVILPPATGVPAGGQAGKNIHSSGPIIVNNAGQPGGLIFTGSINGSHYTTSTTVLKPAVKTEVKFVIIEKDGVTCHILSEQSPITPREMIGISKLLAAVSSATHSVFNWSRLVDSLGIRKHFVKSSTPRSTLTFASHIQVIWLQDPA